MKKATQLFHTMEKNNPDFPRHGKIISTPWKNSPPDTPSPQKFSTLWKTFFHTVENVPSPLNPEPRTLPPPLLMGILNLTPDSFSDGGKYTDPAAAEEQAHKLVADGAHILDIGAESTRPGHDPVSAQEEIRRLLPVLDRLAAGNFKTPISIDTRKAEVARAAFDHGAHILNDVAGLTAPGMLPFAQSGDFPVILMHGIANTLPPADTTPSETIAAWFTSYIPALNLAPERLILDPGLGFGLTREQEIAILDNLAPLTALGWPLLIGLSRKRLVRHLHPDTDPDLVSAQLSYTAWRNGATILRLHNLRPIKQMLDGALPPFPES